VALIGVIMMMREQDAVASLVKEAVAEGKVKPIMRAGLELDSSAQPPFFLRAIEVLWNTWQRELAAQLAHDFVMLHPNEKLGQYWLRQVLEIEPDIAEEVLQPEFLDVYYQPNLAASCGPAG
jgi:hypothetical protein